MKDVSQFFLSLWQNVTHRTSSRLSALVAVGRLTGERSPGPNNDSTQAYVVLRYWPFAAQIELIHDLSGSITHRCREFFVTGSDFFRDALILLTTTNLTSFLVLRAVLFSSLRQLTLLAYLCDALGLRVVPMKGI